MLDIQYEKTPRMPVRWHPVLQCVPSLKMNEHQALHDDIEANGIQKPIVFHGEYVISGRERYMIARGLQIEYPRVEFDGDDVVQFIVTENLISRGLSKKQIDAIMASIEKLPEEDRILPKIERNDSMAKRATKTEQKAEERGVGDNSKMTDEQEQNLFFHHLAKIRKKKDELAKINGELRNLYKTAKSDSILKKDIDFALADRKSVV